MNADSDDKFTLVDLCPFILFCCGIAMIIGWITLFF